MSEERVSPLLARVEGDLVASRRAQDRDRTLLVGTVLSEIRNREIELRRTLADDDVVDVIRRAIKRRRESQELYRSASRHDLADREGAEAAMLEGYLPAAASVDDIRAAVRAAIAGGATQMGAVMAQVMPAFRGRADGGTVNAIVREELAGKIA